MHFFSLFSFATSAVLAAEVAQPNVITNYITGVGKIEKFLNLDGATKVNFTADDLSKINAKLMNPKAVEDLVVDGVVSFNVTDLSVSEAEAQGAIIAASMATKDLLENSLKNNIANKTDEANIEETKKEIRAIINALSKVENLENKSKAQIDAAFKKHPETAAVSRATVKALPGVYDKEVLDYVNLFFGVANESNPEVADLLVQVVDFAQTEHEIFPNDYYKKLQKAFAGKKY